MRCIGLVFASVLGSVSLAQEPLSLPPLPAAVSQTYETSLPHPMIPLSPDATEWVCYGTPNTLDGKYKTGMHARELLDWMVAALEDVGWTVHQKKLDGEYFSLNAHTPSRHFYAYYRDVGKVTLGYWEFIPEYTHNPWSGDAGEILHAMLRTYRDARSYADTGHHTYLYSTSDSVTSRRFSIRFRHPEDFRMEYVTPTERTIIHADSSRVRSYRTDDGDDRHEEDGLWRALHWDRGKDHVSRTVPVFMATPDKPPLSELQEPRVVGREDIGGVRCVVIEADSFSCLPARLWIEEESHLLRKYTTATYNDGTLQTEVVEFYPVLNGHVTDEELEYNKGGMLHCEVPSMIDEAWATVRGFIW